MKRSTVPVALVLCIALGAAWGLLGIHTAASQSPDAWRQLSLPAFVQEITRLTSAAEPLPDALWSEIRSQSAQRLVQAVASGASADYGDLVSLYLWARPNLAPAERETVLAGLVPGADRVSGWTYDELQTVHARMNEAALPTDMLHQLVLAWLAGRDPQTIENIDHLGWLFAQVQLAHRQETGPQEFSIRWTGLLRAPADGAYRLSTCPLRLDFRSGQTFREQSLQMFVAQEQVLDSTRAGGMSQADPVTLQAGQDVPLRIELSFACSSAGVIDELPAAALLYWEAPGLARQLVPTSALRTPDGSQAGLLGQYTVSVDGKPVTTTRVDAQLNFVWFHQCFLVSPIAETRARLADQLYAVATEPGTLARWEQEPATNPARWQAHWAVLESLSVSRHKTWAQMLLAHPALLEACTRQDAATVYSRCRFGAPDETLQTLGLWAQLHQDEMPALAVDYYLTNRRVYRELSRKMTSQDPPRLEQFERDYLVLPDGGCALPAAYTLAYGYWVQGNLLTWIDQLDARLADDQLAGDRRVNWLLARAQAEEIRHSRPHEHYLTMDCPLAGRAWLEEATLVPQSEEPRLRAYRELAARLAAEERLDAAGSTLDAAAQRCRAAESTAALAQWRTELASQYAVVQQRQAQQELLAQEAYVTRLRTRYQRAANSGDTAAAARYKDLLSAAGASSE